MIYRLKHCWRDGTTHVIYEPLELMERLAVLAPASAFRPLIVPQKEAPSPAAHTGYQGGVATAKSKSCEAKDQYGSRPRNYPWAQLMARVFSLDVLESDRCSGRLRILAAIHSPDAIRAILECLGLPSRAPPISPALEDKANFRSSQDHPFE